MENLEEFSDGDSTVTLPIELLEVSKLQDVLSLDIWNTLDPGEQQELGGLLPEGADEMIVANLLRGNPFHFGSPVEQCWSQMRAGLLHPKVLQYRGKAEELQRVEAMQARRDIHNNLVYKLVKETSQQYKPQDSDSSGEETMEDEMALSRSCLARRKREERCLLVLDVLRRVFITSPGRSATYEQLAEIAAMTLLPSMRPGLDSKEAIENMVRLATFLLSTRPTEEPYVCSSSVARMWTWQRDTDLPEDELYALSEELTVIVNSDSKVADLEGLADHIPAAPTHVVGAWQDIDDSPRVSKPYLGAAAGRTHHVGAVASTVAATQEKLDTKILLPMVVDEFITEFRQQEKERYTESPTMAYEFFDRRVSNRIVVGPALRPGPGGDRKMRDHPMLISERPAHVNLKNLVIDAVARLEGQAGNRAQVCGKIRESQFIVPTCSEAQISSWVGGALDRMQTEKWDPAVTFDMDRKLWVYLHADRTVENWKEKSKELQAAKRHNTSSDPPIGGFASEVEASNSSPPPAKAVKVEPPAAPAMPQAPPQPAAPPHALTTALLQPGPATGAMLQPGAMIQPGAPATAMTSAVNSLLGMAAGMKSESSHSLR